MPNYKYKSKLRNELEKKLEIIELENKNIRISNSNNNYEKIKLKDMKKELQEKIKSSSTLPHLVATISEIIYNQNRKIDGIILKTSNRLNIFLSNEGLIDKKNLNLNSIYGVNKDSYYLISRLPPEYDFRVRAMEVDENPNQTYQDIGGLDNQIQELIEAIVLPLTQIIKFNKIGIIAPKGVLLYGPPGMGKTLLARACASQTNAKFFKIGGPNLVQMYIGEGASLVRETFKYAKETQPSIIFIDEIDAIGMKRSISDSNGDHEVQRTMLELLNQLDGFSLNSNVKIIAATNRIDILDPALLRSGRLDRKIEFPYPTLGSRLKILKIHCRKIRISEYLELLEIAKITENFNGAQLKALCVEAGIIAIRKHKKIVIYDDFMEAFLKIKYRKDVQLKYII
ncbi:26S protease regulatory SU 6A [Guillardia theta]|uniref:26S protease regulatory SU 6A n=1 Tax=Guillardia theta TaxID=55529 RepID=Q9AVY3_GUITH|nr:26S protease regulatory SU 6A [Guillardia theta]CAC27088.1 26S protease regulatory SU 6A [Guillardia theta]|mmetsp:Transcript_44541/g.140536  ORF Transcript_44541/g.140536 Transcript_44541/m.140536 type:complete len:398 (-) Transcript_44541:2903-4096(-)